MFRSIAITLTLCLTAIAPAKASLVYLNDTEVLDTNTNLVWLAPWVTEGLGPVNDYTNSGWRMLNEIPITRSVFHVAWTEYYGGNLNYEGLLDFFGNFIEGAPITGPTVGGTTWYSSLVIGGVWPPAPGCVDDGIVLCGLGWISATLRLDPTLPQQYPGAFSDIVGDPIMRPASGVWPNDRMFLVRDHVIPIPAAVWLFGSALGVMGWLRRKATA